MAIGFALQKQHQQGTQQLLGRIPITPFIGCGQQLRPVLMCQRQQSWIVIQQPGHLFILFAILVHDF